MKLTSVKTIVERLRRMSPKLDMLQCEDVLQAADHLESQEKEIERLEMGWNIYEEEATSKIAKAEAEIERLSKELGECQAGWETGNKAVEYNRKLLKENEYLARLVDEQKAEIDRLYIELEDPHKP